MTGPQKHKAKERSEDNRTSKGNHDYFTVEITVSPYPPTAVVSVTLDRVHWSGLMVLSPV